MLIQLKQTNKHTQRQKKNLQLIFNICFMCVMFFKIRILSSIGFNDISLRQKEYLLLHEMLLHLSAFPTQIVFQDLGYKQLSQFSPVISQRFSNIIPYVSAESKLDSEKFTDAEHLTHCEHWEGSFLGLSCSYALFPSFHYRPLTVTGCLARWNSGLFLLIVNTLLKVQYFHTSYSHDFLAILCDGTFL